MIVFFSFSNLVSIRSCQYYRKTLFYNMGQFHQHFTHSFYTHRSRKCKKIQLSCQYLFTLSGSAGAKAVHRMLMKLSPNLYYCISFRPIIKHVLEQWFPTRAALHTRVLWRGFRAAAKCSILCLFSALFLFFGCYKLPFCQVRV